MGAGWDGGGGGGRKEGVGKYRQNHGLAFTFLGRTPEKRAQRGGIGLGRSMK